MTEDEAMEMFIKAIMSHDGSPMATDGDFYWGKLGDKWMVINSIIWGDGTVQYFLDGAEIKITDEELACPVLTPDEVAAKDAQIERLQEALTWYADLYNYQVAGGGGSPSMVMLPPGATIVDYDNGQRARKALE